MQEQTLILIRHGEGEHLTKKFFSSRPQHPNYRPAHLTPKGHEQALSAGYALIQQGFQGDDIEAVLVSPLPRTIETAQGLYKSGLVAASKEIITDLLIEVSLGNLEGSSTQVWMDQGRTFTDLSDAHSYGGETNEDVAARMKILLRTIKQKYTSGHVILVTHALPIYEIMGLIGQKTYPPVAQPFLFPMSTIASV